MTREEVVLEIATRELSHLSREQRHDLLTDWWSLGPEDAKWETLPLELRQEMQTADEPGDPLAGRYEPLLLIAVSHGYRGTRNEYLLLRARQLGLEVDGVVGEPELLEVCPCCLYRTLDEPGQYDICPVCFWEDDGQRKLDAYSGPNHMTLREGRLNFAAVGACSPAETGLVRKERRDAYPQYDGDVVVTPA